MSESHDVERFGFTSRIHHWVSLGSWTVLHMPGSDGVQGSKSDLGILNILLLNKYEET